MVNKRLHIATVSLSPRVRVRSLFTFYILRLMPILILILNAALVQIIVIQPHTKWYPSRYYSQKYSLLAKVAYHPDCRLRTVVLLLAQMVLASELCQGHPEYWVGYPSSWSGSAAGTPQRRGRFPSGPETHQRKHASLKKYQHMLNYYILPHAPGRVRQTQYVWRRFVSYTRLCETSAGCLRSSDPTIGMRQLFRDATKDQWRHN